MSFKQPSTYQQPFPHHYSIPPQQPPNILNRRDLWPEIQKLLQKPVHTPQSLTTSNVLPHSYIPQSIPKKQIIQKHYQQPTINQNRITNNIRSQIQTIPQQQIFQQPPKSHSRLEHVPYTRKYYELEAQQVVNVVYVPVERIKTEYYAIEHILDYQTVPYQETIIEYVPEEKINMKVQYQLVEKKITHYPKTNDIQFNQKQVIFNPTKVEEIPNKYKTHYVTSDVPPYKISIETQATINKRQKISEGISEDYKRMSNNLSKKFINNQSDEPQFILPGKEESNEAQFIFSGKEISKEPQFIFN